MRFKSWHDSHLHYISGENREAQYTPILDGGVNGVMYVTIDHLH